MATVTNTRIQDDLSSIVLTSFALARPAGRLHGLRTGGSFFRADLSAAAPTHAKEAQSVYWHNVAGVGDFHHSSIDVLKFSPRYSFHPPPKSLWRSMADESLLLFMT